MKLYKSNGSYNKIHLKVLTEKTLKLIAYIILVPSFFEIFDILSIWVYCEILIHVNYVYYSHSHFPKPLLSAHLFEPSIPAVFWQFYKSLERKYLLFSKAKNIKDNRILTGNDTKNVTILNICNDKKYEISFISLYIL